MKIRWLKTTTAIALFCAMGTASATLITFDDLIHPGQVGPTSGSGFVDYGYQFSANMDAIDLSRSGSWCWGVCSGHSGKYGALNNYYGNMVMTKQGGGTFSVQDLWLRDWRSPGGNATVVGLLNGGVVGSVNVSLLDSWSDVVLNFGSVDTLMVNSRSVFTIDDIRVNSTTVPEPATLGLLALGMAGLGAARRKKKN